MKRSSGESKNFIFIFMRRSFATHVNVRCTFVKLRKAEKNSSPDDGWENKEFVRMQSPLTAHLMLPFHFPKNWFMHLKSYLLILFIRDHIHMKLMFIEKCSKEFLPLTKRVGIAKPFYDIFYAKRRSQANFIY